MVAAADLIAAVSARIVETEMARRIPDWDGRELAPPSSLPPLTLLADRAFPRPALERRLRFLRVMGWYPDHRRAVAPGVDPQLPPEATVEDHLAVIVGASAATALRPPALPPPAAPAATGPAVALTAAPFPDPATAALVGVLRLEGPSRPPDPGDIAALAAFFDRQADAVDPRWREHWPGDGTPAVTAWAPAEATARCGDRYFRSRPADRAWAVLSAVIWRLAEQKRRLWG